MASGRAVLGLVIVVSLLMLVAVAFRAEQGLPLSSSYRVSVDLPDAQRLAPGDAVRIGGVRAGRVATVDADLEAVPPVARITLALDGREGPLPDDTRTRVRQASVLGASYVELRPGSSERTIPAGGALSPDLVSETVQLTDLLEIFDRQTGRSMQSVASTAARALAGRGVALNSTTESLAPLLGQVARVSRTLARPATRLEPAIVGFGRFVAGLRSAGDALPGLLAGGGRTFAAVVAEGRALRSAITLAPAAEVAVQRAFTRLSPTLDDLADAVDGLRRATPMLAPALSDTDRALRSGRPALAALQSTARPVRRTLAAVDDLTSRPQTAGSLRRGRDISLALTTTLETLTPAQVHCNVISLWGENFANGFGSLGFFDGPSAASVFLTHLGAEGEMLQNAKPSPNVAINNNPRQNAEECEAGNEQYTGTQTIGNPPGLQSREVRRTRPPADALRRARAAGLIPGGEG